MIQAFLRKQLHQHQDQSRLLKQCRDALQIDPILKLPMLKVDQSRLVRWRLGWLPGGKPKPCRCGFHLTKTHVIRCLHLHARLSIGWKLSHDPLFFLLNRLPSSPPTSHRTFRRWTRSWPIIKHILLELKHLQHPDHAEPPTTVNTEDPFLTGLPADCHLLPLPLPVPPDPSFPFPLLLYFISSSSYLFVPSIRIVYPIPLSFFFLALL